VQFKEETMSTRRLDASWKEWLQENVARRCDPQVLLDILIKNGFTLASIKEAMGNYFPTRSPLLAFLKDKPEDIDYEAICNVHLTRLGQDSGVKRFPSQDVQLYTIDKFMSEAECDAIAGIIDQTLRPSTVTEESYANKYFRTSSTSDLGLLKNKTVEALDEKIARTLGIQVAYSEAIQGQRYAVGQEFKSHTDFFTPGTQEYCTHASNSGNRTWTFLVYLNDVPQGGGTSFIELNHVFQPQKGTAVAWNNLCADGRPNYATLHAGLPVIEGHKTIITKWFRERGIGPMFYHCGPVRSRIDSVGYHNPSSSIWIDCSARPEKQAFSRKA
jgi:prolyl 4-hydroxylase